MRKPYLQCGYEDDCNKKDCIHCKRRRLKVTFSLTLAEQIAIEDFAVCDLRAMIEEKPESLELAQDLMNKIMMKMFKEERKYEKK